MPRVAVIVVNWNGARYLRSCLKSLLDQTYRDTEIIMVDNASCDGSADLVSHEFPGVKVIQNSENEGFAAANNRAIQACRSDFIATLNNDARAEPDWLASLLEVMESDSTIGACASKMVFEQAPHIINSTGISLDRAGIAWDRLGGQLDADENQQPCEVFGACAGAALYRRTMLDEIGLFDEDFFAYLEDVDLSWRARLAGWRCVYVPAAKVYHVHSGTAQEGSKFKNYLLGRNKVWTILKNYPSPELFWLLPVIVSYDLASVVYAGFARRDWTPAKGRMAALRCLPAVLAKRKVAQSRRRVSSRVLGAHFAPLARPGKVLLRYEHLKTIKRPERA